MAEKTSSWKSSFLEEPTAVIEKNLGEKAPVFQYDTHPVMKISFL